MSKKTNKARTSPKTVRKARTSVQTAQKGKPLSGKTKKLIVDPFMVLLGIAVGITTFFFDKGSRGRHKFGEKHKNTRTNCRAAVNEEAGISFNINTFKRAAGASCKNKDSHYYVPLC